MNDWNSKDHHHAAAASSSAAVAAAPQGPQLAFASTAGASLLPPGGPPSASLSELLPEAPRAVSISVERGEGRHGVDGPRSSGPLHHHQHYHPLAGVRLGDRLAGDVAVAAVVTGVVSPFLTVVDKAIVQRAAGSHTVLTSVRTSLASMVSQPIPYLRSPAFLWMWATYAATYSAANSLRTLTEQLEHDALQSRTCSAADHERQKKATPAALFVGTTVVNSTASLVKDRAYAQMFGSSGTASAVTIPRISYGLWVARDLTVIGSSFVLPSYVGRHLQDQHGWNPASASKFAQVATPMAAQLVAGPLHYVGLDCFTRPLPSSSSSLAGSASSMSSVLANARNRLQQLVKAAPEVITARMVRILPAYGVAGVYNTQLRDAYRNYLIEGKVRDLMAMEAAENVRFRHGSPAVSTAAAVTLSRRATANDLAALIRAQGVRRGDEPPRP